MVKMDEKDLLISIIIKMIAIGITFYGMFKSFSGMMFFTYLIYLIYL